MQPRVFVDFLEHQLSIAILIRIIQELNPFENLKTIDSTLLKLIDSYGIMRRFVIEADLLSLNVDLALVLGTIYRFTCISILELFVIDDHLFTCAILIRI